MRGGSLQAIGLRNIERIDKDAPNPSTIVNFFVDMVDGVDASFDCDDASFAFLLGSAVRRT